MHITLSKKSEYITNLLISISVDGSKSTRCAVISAYSDNLDQPGHVNVLH